MLPMGPKPEPYQPLPQPLPYRWTASHSTTQITASFLSTHPCPHCPPFAWGATWKPLYSDASVPGQDRSDQGLSSWSSKWETPALRMTGGLSGSGDAEMGEVSLRFDFGHPVARAVGSWLDEVPLGMGATGMARARAPGTTERQEGNSLEQSGKEVPGLREYEECVMEMREQETRSLSADRGRRDDEAVLIAHGADLQSAAGLLDTQGDIQLQRRLRAQTYPVRPADRRSEGVRTPDPETERAASVLGLGARRENAALTAELRAGRERVLRRLRERAEEEERERSEKESRKWTAGLWWAQ